MAGEKIISDAQVQSRTDVRAVEAERPFEPRNGFKGFAQIYQYGSTIGIAVRIARIRRPRVAFAGSH
jgi:hypothetical protein